MMHNKKNPIGIFDSGLGGVSTLGQAMHMLPKEKFIYYGDSGMPPYALMPEAEIKEHCIRICDFLADRHVKAILVACNTATFVAYDDLNARYDMPVLGIAPEVESATKEGGKGKIVVIATEYTVKNEILQGQIRRYGGIYDIESQACREMIDMVESGVIDGPSMEACIRRTFDGFDAHAISSVVLGCTHFGFLEKSIRKVLGDPLYIADGNAGIIRRLIRILDDADLRGHGSNRTCEVEIHNSGGPVFVENARNMLEKHLINLARQ